MRSPTKEDIALLKESGLFDADWYRSAYSDVRSLKMDPAEHYLSYGQPMGRMSADGERIDIPILKKLQRLPAPAKGRALLEATKICQNGDDELGLAYARKHLPEEFAYTLETLRANDALRRGDEAAWLVHMNAYLDHFGACRLRLEAAGTTAGTIFDRLACAPLPPVTGGPLVSVIMPAWNAEKTVRKAAKSILDQTWCNLELLIVDDASTDGTWAMLKQLAASDARVKIFQNTVNVGPYVSKNVALGKAKGCWVTGHDADDWAHPQRLDVQVRGAQMRNLSACLAHMIRIQPSGNLSHLNKISSFSFDGVARKALISCLFDRKVLIEKLGYWDSVRFGADSEMTHRAETILGDRVGALQHITMICLDLETSLTNDPVHGVDKNTGISAVRANYRNSWTTWLRDKASGGNVYLEFPQNDRRYDAAQEMIVPWHDQMVNLKQANS